MSGNSCVFPAGPIFVITHICFKALSLQGNEELPWVSLARLYFEGWAESGEGGIWTRDGKGGQAATVAPQKAGGERT